MDITQYGRSPYAPGGAARGTQVPGYLAAALRGYLGQEEPGSVMEPGAADMRSVNRAGEGVGALSDLLGAVPAKALGLAGIFIGPKARTWNYKAAEQAAKLLRSGVDPEEVRRLTNTFMGADGMVRQEISDRALRLRTPFETMKSSVANNFVGPPTMALGGVIEHPELFAAYPEMLRDGRITMRKYGDWFPDSAEYGRFGGNDIQVRAKTEDTAKNITVHELQHYVQKIEDFARGGSPDEFMNKARQAAASKGESEEWAANLAYRNYLRMGGEVEARLAEQRRGMTLVDLLRTTPTPDTPVNNQLMMWYDW